MNYDILVVGAGIAGMEAALKLGDMGYRVLLAEKEPSIGGKMILLSKVFPTLDCASCISTPRMAAVSHHPNVTLTVHTEVEDIRRDDGGAFRVRLRKKPTFVRPALCTGCRQCEQACPVAVPDQFNFGMVARRAAYIPFPQAVPRKAVIERAGTSPCSFICPAGISAHGYVALVRAGRYREAFDLILERTPLVGSLARTCHAPCEAGCTRGALEGAVPIRAIKRFIADRYYREHPEPEHCPPAEPDGRRVAVVGAGPAGLTAAFHLARRGHAVTVFEAEARPGGGLRTAVEDGRLPAAVLDRDIANVTALGAAIRTGVRVTDPEDLQAQGFDAVILATGAPAPAAPVFAGQLATNENGTVSVDPVTFTTSRPGVFACGEMVSGPSPVVNAVRRGIAAAAAVDRHLRGGEEEPETAERRLPMVRREAVLARQAGHTAMPPVARGEAEHPLTEEEARYSAGRCLDCGICSACGRCAAACPAGAVDLAMREEREEIEAGAVILATGFKLFPAREKPQYGYGRFPNVITAMQMDRLLAPTRPYNAVLRPSDGKVPENIAFVLCTGSRDRSVGNELCSRVCCMYSVKQNQLIMGALPLAEVTVYYIDVRAFGKGYEEFYRQAEAMGANFVKGRVARIEETADQNLILHYEDIDRGGKPARAEHDLVVLAVGLRPNTEALGLFVDGSLEGDAHFYVKEVDEDLNPGRTSVEGVFVAGTASGARDIPDTILHAGAAAAQAAAYVERLRGSTCAG